MTLGEAHAEEFCEPLNKLHEHMYNICERCGLQKEAIQSQTDIFCEVSKDKQFDSPEDFVSVLDDFMYYVLGLLWSFKHQIKIN